ncbi:hypothetical protein AS188_12455 [Kocuria flava]|uniref:Heparan-alpha-glucosaminide N-acetyltransferase catalytic domain-containing protein n=1 Tax=Kocuria flava TaxID=446860 RepID=A0A0U2XQF6_9MICC|nr:heparan-alpha-glucosaminide N-acetyltransferase domain-containing protein [Kocuria flava]ALU40434.1 hypothetical protein AS188_12455 [Kocuria flava]GEO92711.1 hypothetical protein KFL01_20170 [Kocuria flava]
MDDRSTPRRAQAPAAGRAARRPTGRVQAVDAARGLALVGLTAIHFLPAAYEGTSTPTLSWLLFAGDSAALFALVAGVGLALSSGGRRPRTGREMRAVRAGIAVRALLIAALGLSIGYLLPQEFPPAISILPAYGVFFLLSLPFLGLQVRTLLICAGAAAVLAPLLVHAVGGRLPEYSAHNPTFAHLVTEPAALLSQLLLTGTYPALPYLAYLLTGLAVGRLNLNSRRVQGGLLAAGAGLAAVAKLVSWLLLYATSGYMTLLYSIPELTRQQLDDMIVFGPSEALPTNSLWWQVLSAPHANTPFSVLWSLGVAVAAVGALLLIARRYGAWLNPLAAVGAMTLTLYTGQLVLLSFEVHYAYPLLWCLAVLALSVLFALAWRHAFGQGPLERVVSGAAGAARRRVLARGAADGTA